ncbi:hypothetical protein FY534_07835 [Alicyclobacillus sp. TC]|nr:hypothetical protein FY534_07835 [Alicyclobacillus sp. TC]
MKKMANAPNTKISMTMMRNVIIEERKMYINPDNKKIDILIINPTLEIILKYIQPTNKDKRKRSRIETSLR